MNAQRTVSVVVPLFDEAPNVGPLVAAVRDVLDDRFRWELLLVDDGSRDATAELARRQVDADDRVRLVRLGRNYGQATALQAGFDHARGKVVVTLDGDLQNDPRDIPKLVTKLDEGYDLVTGHRHRRKDPRFSRTVPSRVANWLLQRVTGVGIRDSGCGLKAYRRELLDRFRLYADLHRFIPVVAASLAGARIAEVPVRHHPRLRGRSKYGLSRTWKVLADLLTLRLLRSLRRRPMALFGTVAAWMVAAGLGAAVVTVVAKPGGVPVLSLPAGFEPEVANAYVFPGVALLSFGLAVFLVMLGLIAEFAVQRYERNGGGAIPLAREIAP